MIDAVLAFSIKQRWLVLLLTICTAAFGAWNFTRLPIAIIKAHDENVNAAGAIPGDGGWAGNQR